MSDDWEPPEMLPAVARAAHWCTRCGVVVYEVGRHEEYHRTMHDAMQAAAAMLTLLTMRAMPEAIAGLDIDDLVKLADLIERARP